jgi:hypothetical protein
MRKSAVWGGIDKVENQAGERNGVAFTPFRFTSDGKADR